MHHFIGIINVGKTKNPTVFSISWSLIDITGIFISNYSRHQNIIYTNHYFMSDFSG